mmetsp:Transcript_18290/g.25777  ORF Transcript_18290/g.25777 Transcript_18290/m.25777 type:complete len:480 (+) Transcript_18290:140-1579(+)
MIRRSNVTNRSTNESTNANGVGGTTMTRPSKIKKTIEAKKQKVSGEKVNNCIMLLFVVFIFFITSRSHLPQQQNDNKHNHPNSFVRVPSVVLYNSMSNNARALRGSLPRIYEDEKDTVGLNQLLLNTQDPPDESTCQPMHEWQTQNFPQCIRMHEVDMMPRPDSLIFINCGGDRCAWLLLDSDGTKITLKTRKYRKDFTKGFYDAAAKDGLVMERLTKSPYVAGTYGYCGLSQLVEYSEGGNLHDLIKTSRMHDQDPQTPIDRLKVGIQVATAVADLHSFEEDGIPSITHNDLCCHQFILVDGIYKLNDFHLGQFLHKDKNTNQVCQSRTNYNPRYTLLRAPEEQTRQNVVVEKADDFMMGNVMYYVLAKKWLFEIPGYSAARAVRHLHRGERSPFPDHILNSKDPADIAFMKGIEMSWTHEVEKRPSAREISDYLIAELEKIEGKKYSGGAIRASIAPLPEGYRYSDSDYEDNFDRED